MILCRWPQKSEMPKERDVAADQLALIASKIAAAPIVQPLPFAGAALAGFHQLADQRRWLVARRIQRPRHGARGVVEDVEPAIVDELAQAHRRIARPEARAHRAGDVLRRRHALLHQARRLVRSEERRVGKESAY